MDFNNILDKIGGYVSSGLSYVGVNVSTQTGGIIGIILGVLIIYLLLPEKKRN